MIDEGYIKFELDWDEGPLPEPDLATELERWRRPLFAAGLIGCYEELGIGFGNLSVRAARSERFVISGTQTGHLAQTDARHYALVTDFDIEKNYVHCRGPVRASSESMTHAALYALSGHINAVVHVHSAELWQALRDVLPTTAADVAYGTPAMAREFRRLYQQTDFARNGVAVMAGHDEGILAIGHDIATAAQRILALPDMDDAS